jgi:Fur family zinc uptake transcriptional regulator
MKNKEKILDIINSKSCWITAKWISWLLLEPIDKTTIYRNIEKLLNDWIILEDFSKSWEKLYSIKEKHHHHFICNECNKTENIWCFMNSEIKWLEDKFWFKVNNHSFVLNWICKNCI